MDTAQLVKRAVFSNDTNAQAQIRKDALARGITLSSTHNLYTAIARNEVAGFTIPAINLRTLTFDIACLIFEIMQEKNIGVVIFEIARSEMEYTNQSPAQYASSVLAAALHTNYKGPVFLQTDHLQIHKKEYEINKEAELTAIEKIIKDAIATGFYNIDIDASTLVDLSQADLSRQQQKNFHVTALLTNYIRQQQPKDTTISVGGEIGHIGDKKSSAKDLEAFMLGYLPLIRYEGISKVSVQSGTAHGEGGIVDFTLLYEIGKKAREKYGLGGVVQHGASTLPLDVFDKFVGAKTIEIHLSTQFQNMVFDHLPNTLKEEIYTWIKENFKDELTEDLSEEQFLYKLRKKSLGVFKERLWSLTTSEKQPILENIKTYLLSVFEKLNTFNTKTSVAPYL